MSEPSEQAKAAYPNRAAYQSRETNHLRTAFDAGMKAGRAELLTEVEWGVSTVTQERDGEFGLYVSREDSRDTAERQVRQDRASYPFPDEINVVSRMVGEWLPVEQENNQ
jgi:hypothetical protein